MSDKAEADKPINSKVLNEVLDQFKEYNAEWENLTKPILDKRKETLNLCDGMTKYAKVNAKHVILGSCLAMVVNGLTIEELNQSVTLTKEKPYFKAELKGDNFKKYNNIFKCTQDWMLKYWDACNNVEKL